MKTFLLIGQRPEKINRLYVDKNTRLFHEDLSPLLGTTLVYPRNATHKTFSGTVVRKNGRITISVCNPDNHDHFNNNAVPNLLFFNTSIGADTLRLIYTNPADGGQQRIALYHTVTSARGQQILKTKKIDFGDDDNLWAQYSALARHLFIQEFDDGYPVDPKNCHDLQVQTVIGSLSDTEDIVWVNPVCLRLPLTGDELSTPPFPLWAENTQPLWLEPLFQPSQAPRIHFYQYGNLQIQARPSPQLSRMEQLIWGPSSQPLDSPHWQAFAALDALQGGFFLDNQSQYFWQPPAAFSSNARDFADYWLARWHGKEMTDASVRERDLIKSPSYTNTFREAASRPGTALKNDKDYHNRETLFACFQLDKSPVFDVIQKVLSRCPTHVANDLHRGYLTVQNQPDEHYTLTFNAQAYLSEFAQRYIVPNSPLLIELPAPAFLAESAFSELCQQQRTFYQKAINHRSFNPINSTFHGARGFFQQLCVSLENGLQVDDVTPMLQLGWWNHWHGYLYQNAPQSQFRFKFVKQALRVGQAKVSDTTYVGGYRLYQPTQQMCF